VNLGHTVGHALEQATGYKTLLTARLWLCMVAALHLARQRGTISRALERLENLVHLYGPLPALKLRVPKCGATVGDKKNVGESRVSCCRWHRDAG